jgi:hypothetical protein
LTDEVGTLKQENQFILNKQENLFFMSALQYALLFRVIRTRVIRFDIGAVTFACS